jgi:hypothetical protein
VPAKVTQSRASVPKPATPTGPARLTGAITSPAQPATAIEANAIRPLIWCSFGTRARSLAANCRGDNSRAAHRSRCAALGPTVNVMVLQAGVGRRVFADNPDYAREALAGIESAGRRALEELDQLPRVLHSDERSVPAEPLAPSVADLRELADRIRATGREVDLRTAASSCRPAAPGRCTGSSRRH